MLDQLIVKLATAMKGCHFARVEYVSKLNRKKNIVVLLKNGKLVVGEWLLFEDANGYSKYSRQFFDPPREVDVVSYSTTLHKGADKYKGEWYSAYYIAPKTDEAYLRMSFLP